MKKITAKTTMEELAAIVSEHLRSHGLQASLVGGAVVSIYSDNEYQSRDLDFISPMNIRGEGAVEKYEIFPSKLK